MAFPTLNTKKAIAQTFAEIQTTAAQIKAAAQNIRHQAAAGPIDGVRVVRLCETLVRQRAILAAKAQTPGLAEYAAAEMEVADIASEFTAMLAQIDATIAWVTGAMPQTGGYLDLETLNQDGTVTLRMFSTAQTGGLRTALDALIATIA